jgi:hypothetical protein
MRYTGRVIGIILLGIVVVLLMVGVSGHLVYTPPTDCAEQIAEWSVDETSHVDPGCRQPLRLLVVSPARSDPHRTHIGRSAQRGR